MDLARKGRASGKLLKDRVDSWKGSQERALKECKAPRDRPMFPKNISPVQRLLELGRWGLGDQRRGREELYLEEIGNKRDFLL